MSTSKFSMLFSGDDGTELTVELCAFCTKSSPTGDGSACPYYTEGYEGSSCPGHVRLEDGLTKIRKMMEVRGQSEN